jgi:molybdopterin converting factor small subunit
VPQVSFTRHLRIHFPRLEDLQVDAGTLAEVVEELDRRHPGLAAYLVDDRGSLRPHVNLFVNDEVLTDRVGLSDRVGDGDRVFVMQALSGG